MTPSTVTIGASVLRPKCEAVLDNISRIQEGKKAPLIDREMRDMLKDIKRRNWWRRLFRMKLLVEHVTREDAEVRLRDDSNIFSDWNETYFIGGRAWQVASDLLHACKYADRINVTVDDLKYLEGWS